MRLLPWRIKHKLSEALLMRSWTLSQAGQDHWIFGEAFNEQRGGYFVDIGAHDGLHISNTYLLERRYGWNGLCIEANPTTFSILRRNRQATCINVCLDERDGEVEFAMRGVLGGIVSPGLDNAEREGIGAVVRVKAVPLMTVFAQQQVPSVIDYLSIDIEGAEERVLKGFDFDRYRINCLTIERPSMLLRQLFSENGYVLTREILGLDCFYVHNLFMPQYKRNMFDYWAKRRLAIRWG